MSLSCFFDFIAEEKFEMNIWKFKTSSDHLWNVKEVWMEDTDPWYQDQSEDDKVYFHEISLISEEARAYYAELEIFDRNPNNPRRTIVKKLDLNVRDCVKIEFSLYKDTFYRENQKMRLRCLINLYPLFHPGYVQPTCLPNTNTVLKVPAAKVETVEALKNLCRDMKSLLEKGTFSDLTLVCGSKEIKVHKNILCIRAPHFTWDFGIILENFESKKINLDSFELEVLQELLSFIYTGKVMTTDKSVINKLSAVATRYDMKELAIVCTYL